MALIGTVNSIPLTRGANDYANNNTFGSGSGVSLTVGRKNTFIGNNSGTSMTTGNNNIIIGGYTGNQNDLDVRTGSNRIILSEGDGNPRFYMSHDGVTRLFNADYYTVTNNTKGGTVTALPRDVFFPPSYFNVLDTCTIIINCSASEGTSGGYLRTDILHVNYRFGYTFNSLASNTNDGLSMTTWTYAFTSSGLTVTQNWGAGGSNMGTRWSFFITGCLVQG